MQHTTLGLILIAVGLFDVVLLTVIGLSKRKPIVVVAGMLAGSITSLLGILFYLGVIKTG